DFHVTGVQTCALPICPWRQFRHVTLPAIAPTVLLVSIISVASFFQLFAEPYVMTQGGPAQSTVTVLYFMYEEGFKWWNLGSASEIGRASCRERGYNVG